MKLYSIVFASLAFSTMAIELIAKIFDKAAYEEIRWVARNVFDDFEGLVRSDISGNNQCSDKVINWANEVITDAACLRIAIELAYNIDNFLGQSAHWPSIEDL